MRIHVAVRAMSLQFVLSTPAIFWKEIACGKTETSAHKALPLKKKNKFEVL